MKSLNHWYILTPPQIKGKIDVTQRYAVYNRRYIWHQ